MKPLPLKKAAPPPLSSLFGEMLPPVGRLASISVSETGPPRSVASAIERFSGPF
jgi:hypothetical protein